MARPTVQRHRVLQYRLALLISILIILPLGYVVRFYGTAPEWFNDLFGSIAYEIFWILLVALIFPNASPLWTAVGVCLATCVLEFLQLWHPPFLEAMRRTLPGRLVLGNAFTWSDFPAYFFGSLLGWVWMRLCLAWYRR
ncbi:DUF2809 domain-containing protein [Allocoleopsis sp.]|uniref:ribosomal maturation YjgA family protein n=1 Tax=Allocoleopsis sp. TaxID=3088169 RepID=UPI002FCFF013